jgi:hypothetical protein
MVKKIQVKQILELRAAGIFAEQYSKKPSHVQEFGQ